MKKLLLILISSILLTGCTNNTISVNEDNEETRVFSINETATVNKTKIKINSVTKVLSDCFLEYGGKCHNETTPDNDYFLVVDLTIENNGTEDLAISSLLTFELKDSVGEKGKLTYMLNTINSQLDGSIMPNDLLKGQIAYDVKESDTYTFYYLDSLLDSNIKFIINKTDIIE